MAKKYRALRIRRSGKGFEAVAWCTGKKDNGSPCDGRLVGEGLTKSGAQVEIQLLAQRCYAGGHRK